ncbi:MAG: haloacid dehalogenase-like hydrolase [Coriobacteriales bacterium]|nr:haloacid dehalogenase-like hydrolase [Coriobacteriales bacterium]
MTMAAVTAFDLDGTLLDGQSGWLIVRYLSKHDYISKKTTALCAWWGVRYKLHLPLRQDEVREHIFKDLGRFGPEQVHDIMEAFHNEVIAPRYKKRGIQELKSRIEAGEHVILISATFDELAQIARAYLGCEAALATRMEMTPDGRFTGRVLGETCEGGEKVLRINAWADSCFGKNAWSLVRAYGDHHSDIPMLESAKQAFAVDPGTMLKHEAAQRNWPVLEWRDDA